MLRNGVGVLCAWMQRRDDVIFLSSLIKIDTLPRPLELLLLGTGSFDPKNKFFGLDLSNLGLRDVPRAYDKFQSSYRSAASSSQFPPI